MKKLVVALGALLAASAVHAQETQRNPEARRPVGIGVAIEPFAEGAGSLSTFEVYIPVALTPMLRIEPSIGILSHNRPTGQRDTRDITLGAGLFYMMHVAAPFDLYAGGRLKLNFAHVSDPSDSGTDVVLAGALGGEYYLSPHFSLGAEAQFGWRDNSNVSGDDSFIFTTGLAFFRFYF
jgi:Outer membrane protein beta-barrel domain